MQKFKNVRVITTCAMLLALATIFGFFKIPINSLIEIRFSSIPVAIAAALFGPAVGGIVGGAADILQYLVKPTGAYFPGFTISYVMTGVLFGLALYTGNKEHKLTVWRILLGEILVTAVCSCLINNINLCILYSMPFLETFLTRLPKALIMIPINTALISVVAIPLNKTMNKFLQIW